MRYSTLGTEAASRDVIDTFGGYNHNLKINNNEFYDMQNLTADGYPVLSPRGKRGVYKKSHISISAILGRDKLCYADTNGKVYIDDVLMYECINTDISGHIIEPKQLVSMGAYVVILPNKEYFNSEDTPQKGLKINNESGYTGAITSITFTGQLEGANVEEGALVGKYIFLHNEHAKITANTTTTITFESTDFGTVQNNASFSIVSSADRGSIEATFESESGENTVTFSLCHYDAATDEATPYQGAAVSPNPPSPAESGTLWVDTSQTPHILKRYAIESSMWVTIPTTYVQIACTGIGKKFKQHDGVKISGIDSTVSGLQTLAKELNGKTSIIQKCGKNYIVVIGMLDAVKQQTATLTVERKMPDMDIVIEANNRLWGCRHGTGEDGKTLNEIYASKLGDFKNWNCYQGISTDSYTASVGSFGNFTGAINYLGYPLFFKEDCVHKVYGSFPANFQIQKTDLKGVQMGAANSLAIVGTTLFYKSRTGVCAYDGSLSTDLSANFGGVQYSAMEDTPPGGDPEPLWDGAVGCAARGKYYISMRSEKDNQWYVFVYDTRTGMWHKEDNLRIRFMCSYNDEIYFFDSGTLGTVIKTIFGTTSEGETPDGDVSWMAETGVYGLSMPDQKYISKLNIRMSLDIGARVMFYAQYDSHGEWEHLASMTGTSLRSFTVPIRPKRCDHFRLRIEGIGDAKIYSIARTFEQGSDEV